MADEAVMEEGATQAQNPLVAVTFQRNVHRKEKYLEAEPKALGITQIGLSLFQITCVAVFLSKDLSQGQESIPFFISSLLVVIAGSVAITAQNLHLPTLRACFAMEIVACGASVVNMILTLVTMDHFAFLHFECSRYDHSNFSSIYGETCFKMENGRFHFAAESVVVQVTLLAISAALAAYCCKVVNCCGPAPKMPVITVQTPAVQQ